MTIQMCTIFQKPLYKWLELVPNANWEITRVAITNVQRGKMSLNSITTIYGEKLHRCLLSINFNCTQLHRKEI